ncbi:hypothetical protein HPP92_023670 [Vanilla planifolia]|uniref:Uncharacterized protein n=1 Tax=Vanilla planifolia TaxID=51239 RepID=A0A835UEP0_VANPL|nr:hypothetical protein HPP92_023670 [Vanilla planifolia]
MSGPRGHTAFSDGRGIADGKEDLSDKNCTRMISEGSVWVDLGSAVFQRSPCSQLILRYQTLRVHFGYHGSQDLEIACDIRDLNEIAEMISLPGNAAAIHRSRPWPDVPTSVKSFGRFNNSACMEELLINCAHAIESNDATLAQQILWVLNNIAPPDGDSNQRLTSAILRSLILRASRSGSAIASTIAASCTQANTERYLLRLSAVALANFIDLTPWHRFGFSAANSAIANITEGYPVLHLVDLTTTHSMQIPTLIDALAARLEGPPLFASPSPPPPPIFRPPLSTSPSTSWVPAS